MTRTLLPLGLIAGLMAATAGCIIYDEEVKYHEVDDRYDDERYEEDGDDDGFERPDIGGDEGRDDNDEDDGNDVPASVVLSPSAGVAGETLIVSVLSRGDVDLSEVAELTFFGPSEVEILASAERSINELLLTVDLAGEAELGANDLLIEFENGSAIYLDEAFTVVLTPDELPEDDEPELGDLDGEDEPVDHDEDGMDEDDCP